MLLPVLLRISRGFLMLIFLQAVYLPVAQVSYAQNILKLYGQVIDEQAPIFNALVTIENTNLRAYTDQDGFYYFYDIPPGEYKLVCSFQSISVYTGGKIAVNESSPTRRDIFLKSGVINIPPIYVESAMPPPSEHTGYIVKIYDLEQKSDKSIDEIIGNIPGLSLITSTATGEINLSANGIRPEGVNVLIDGRRINSLLTGRADLGQLPLKAISGIEYYTPGAAATAADGALGGTVNFITHNRHRPDFIEVSLANGSFGDEDYSVGAAVSRPVFGKLSGLWEKGFRRNNYDCTDNFGEIKTRENSFTSYNKYYLSYSKKVLGYYLSLSGFIYDGRHGVPGPINAPSLNAVSKKELISSGAELSRVLGQKSRLNASLFYIERTTSYKDYGSWVSYDTKYYEREFKIVLGAEYYRLKWLSLNTKITYADDLLNGLDNIRPQSALGKISRQVYTVQNGINYCRDISLLSLSSGLSYSYSRACKKDYTGFSWSSSIVYKKGISLGWRNSYAKAFRLPGLAETHWQEDVFVIANPDLKPERSRSITSELFSEFKFLGDWRFSLEYRDIRYKDMIYWRRSQGLKFKPMNVSRSDLFSAAVVVAYKSPGDLFNIDFSRIRSVPLNREENPLYYGKYIIHQPLYTNRLKISLNYHGHFFSVEMYDSGERYFIEDNTKKLDPCTLVNLKAGIKMRFKTLQAMWEFKILNLTDKKYELLEYQPMPPRSYHCGVTFKI